MWFRCRRTAFVAVIVSTLFLRPVAAKDFEVLTRVLYAADLADQANAFCSLSIPEFSSSHAGPLGDMRAYMLHIKREVTYRLPEDDALLVLVSAANAAREHMRRVLRDIRAGGTDVEQENSLLVHLDSWSSDLQCDQHA